MKKMKNNEFLFLEEYFLFLKPRHQYSFFRVLDYIIFMTNHKNEEKVN